MPLLEHPEGEAVGLEVVGLAGVHRHEPLRGGDGRGEGEQGEGEGERADAARKAHRGVSSRPGLLAQPLDHAPHLRRVPGARVAGEALLVLGQRRRLVVQPLEVEVAGALACQRREPVLGQRVGHRQQRRERAGASPAAARWDGQQQRGLGPERAARQGPASESARASAAPRSPRHCS